MGGLWLTTRSNVISRCPASSCSACDACRVAGLEDQAGARSQGRPSPAVSPRGVAAQLEQLRAEVTSMSAQVCACGHSACSRTLFLAKVKLHGRFGLPQASVAWAGRTPLASAHVCPQQVPSDQWLP